MFENKGHGLPEIGDLKKLMGLQVEGGDDELVGKGDVDALVAKTLLEPLQEFLQRPSKKFRGQLVHLGFRLAGESKELSPNASERDWCELGAELLEAIHAASLVVDDIQDMSLYRRGAPTLHRQHGIPVALNAGNWLYFWPLEKIASWELDKGRELAVYRLVHQALLRAHFGQAIDVGVPIDSLSQDRIPSVCLASLQLKTGALMGLAMALGATLGGAQGNRLRAIEHFGQSFGVALQMFDDLGNLKAHGDVDPKQFEDLLLRRPSWVWASAAKYLDGETFKGFCEVVRELPDSLPLQKWISQSSLRMTAKEEAKSYLEASLKTLEASLPGNGFSGVMTDLFQIAERLGISYE